MKLKIILYFFVFSSFLFASCKQNEETKDASQDALSSALVNNPATASGDTLKKAFADIFFVADTFA